MEKNEQDPTSGPVFADGPELDLYTIPARASWFSWGDIHGAERDSLWEFFDGSSITRTPKIYKDYRDFIISKYREDPSRRLTFTEVRKSLIGDVSLLQKVFRFLDRWGLINFSATCDRSDTAETADCAVKKEEGVPNAVRVVMLPYTLKTVGKALRVRDDDELKIPTLASYSDVYENSLNHKDPECSNCREPCDAGYYECQKEKLLLCKKCFESSAYDKSKSAEDFMLMDGGEICETPSTSWTEEENLLLLESIVKHGDDWDLVAQNVKSKSKLDCISRVVEMPFGDLVFNSRETNPLKKCDDMGERSQEQVNRPPSTEAAKTDVSGDGEDESENAPHKRKFSDTASSLTKQMRRISEISDPKVMSAADEAAFRALCEENPCVRVLFEPADVSVVPKIRSQDEVMPPILRIRSAAASALGVAAAHSKLLADQEVEEMEKLVGNMIETQLKKLQAKVKKFEALEAAMEEEYGHIQELKQIMVEDRLFSFRASRMGESQR